MPYPDLKVAIAYAESVQDYISRDLFQEILEDEEEHVDWLETQLDLIDRIGLGELPTIATAPRLLSQQASKQRDPPARVSSFE